MGAREQAEQLGRGLAKCTFLQRAMRGVGSIGRVPSAKVLGGGGGAVVWGFRSLKGFQREEGVGALISDLGLGVLSLEKRRQRYKLLCIVARQQLPTCRLVVLKGVVPALDAR